MTIVWGIDSSLTRSGIAVIDTAAKTVELSTVSSTACARVEHPSRRKRVKGKLVPVKVVPEDSMAIRLDAIRAAIVGGLIQMSPGVDPVLAVIEALPPHLPGGGHHERAGLFWTLAADIAAMGVPIAAVWPASRAMYATGNGNDDKASVVAATVKRYQLEDVTDDNMIDALLLAAMGCRHLGEPVESTATEDMARALRGVIWPEGTRP